MERKEREDKLRDFLNKRKPYISVLAISQEVKIAQPTVVLFLNGSKLTERKDYLERLEKFCEEYFGYNNK